MRLILLSFCLALLGTTSGCLFHSNKQTKSEAHIYRGDAPTIHFNTENERAGGDVHTY